MSKFSIVEAENDYLANRPKLSKHRPALYPSECSVEYDLDGFHFVAGACARAIYYRVKEMEAQPVSMDVKFKGIMGKVIEVSNVDRWKAMGIWVDNNVKFFNPRFIISGEQDVIIRNPETGNLMGVENKTYSGNYASKEILGYKRPPKVGHPKLDHYLQAITYYWEYKNEIPEYRIYYMDRENTTRVEFEIGTELVRNENMCWYQQIPSPNWGTFIDDRVYLPFTIEMIEARYKKVVDYIKQNILPPKDYGALDADKIEYLYAKQELAKKNYEPWKKDPGNNPIVDWQCWYCKFSGICKRDEVEQSI